MSIRQQLGQLLWQHGVENDALLDALDWKMRKIMDERDRLREALTIFADWYQTHPDAILPKGLEHADFALALNALAKE